MWNAITVRGHICLDLANVFWCWSLSASRRTNSVWILLSFWNHSNIPYTFLIVDISNMNHFSSSGIHVRRQHQSTTDSGHRWRAQPLEPIPLTSSRHSQGMGHRDQGTPSKCCSPLPLLPIVAVFSCVELIPRICGQIKTKRLRMAFNQMD